MAEHNRVQLDIQGSVYTFPINPIDYDPLNDFDIASSRTVDGELIRYTSNFDQRQRVMRWENLPNTSNFNTLLTTLRAAIGLSGVKMNHRGLSIYANVDYWEPVRIDDVQYFLSSDSSYLATSKLKYNLDLTFSYMKQTASFPNQTFALFTYQPDDYANTKWIASVSGYKGLDVIIVHPNLGPINASKLRAAFPQAKLIVYTNAQEMEMGQYSSGYFTAVNQAMYSLSGYLMTFLTGPSPGWQFRGVSYPLTYESMLNKPLADKLVYVVSGNCKGVYNGFEYDGVYLDMFTPTWPAWKRVLFTNFVTISGYGIDIDGDGLAESPSELDALYPVAKNYFASGMRLALPDKIIIANTAGGSYHESLNGICIENVGEVNTFAEANEWFATQRRYSKYEPKINIAWAISHTSSGGTKNFCDYHENVYNGLNRSFWWL